MVIRRLLDEQVAGRFDARTLTIDALETHYRAAQTACDADPESMAYVKRWFMGPKIIAELEATMAEPMANLTRARETLVALQRSEPAVLAMWKVIVDVTMKSCYANCARHRHAASQGASTPRPCRQRAGRSWRSSASAS